MFLSPFSSALCGATVQNGNQTIFINKKVPVWKGLKLNGYDDYEVQLPAKKQCRSAAQYEIDEATRGSLIYSTTWHAHKIVVKL